MKLPIRWFRSMEQRVGNIESMLQQLIQGQQITMASLADIKAKVEAEKSVEDSAVALLQSISQQLKDAIANNDQAALQAVADMLDSNTAALSAAVIANTPAASTTTSPTV